MMTRSEKGSVLIAVIVAIVIFSALGAGLASLVTTSVRSSADHSLSTQAMYLAESGFERARWELRENSEDWIVNNTCTDLKNEMESESLGNGYFDIRVSGVKVDAYNEAIGCEIQVLGWVGSEDYENALASRRITMTVSAGFIEGGNGFEPVEDNIFDDEEHDWDGGNNVELDEGMLSLRRPGHQGAGQSGGNTNTKADLDLTGHSDFGVEDAVCFFFDIDWDNVAGEEGTRLKIEVDNFEEEIVLFSLEDQNLGESRPYKVLLELGSGYSADDIEVTITADFKGVDSVDPIYLSNGCIGTHEDCFDSTDQGPVGDDWEEG